MNDSILPPQVVILCRDCRRVYEKRRWVRREELPVNAEKVPALLCPACLRRRSVETSRRTA